LEKANILSNSLIACALYYFAWIYILPKLRGYRIRQEILQLDDGAQSHKLVKVPISDLQEWDSQHDALGRQLSGHSSPIESSKVEGDPASEGKRFY